MISTCPWGSPIGEMAGASRTLGMDYLTAPLDGDLANPPRLRVVMARIFDAAERV